MTKEKRYLFSITIAGDGTTPEEAWNDAVTSFSMDAGCCPDEYETEEVETEWDLQ